MDENIYVLIGRSLNGQQLTPHQVNRIIHHYAGEVDRHKETISRVRETLNNLPRMA